MAIVLFGSISAVCALVTLAHGVEKILENLHPQKQKAPVQKTAGAEIISLGEYRSWKNAVSIYDRTIGKERNA